MNVTLVEKEIENIQSLVKNLDKIFSESAHETKNARVIHALRHRVQGVKDMLYEMGVELAKIVAVAEPETVQLTPKEFEQMSECRESVPFPVVLGKRWKRNFVADDLAAPNWYMGEFVMKTGEPWIMWRKIRITNEITSSVSPTP